MNAAAGSTRTPEKPLLRVVVTGSECTGKTTLAHQLGQRFGVEVVPEFVRTFAQTVGGRLNFADHGPIARGQMALADTYWARAKGLSILDTDLLSTVVYCRHYFERCPEWIDAASLDRKPDLYLLCDIDVPWTPDTLRDRGDRREEMHQMFVDQLGVSGAPWRVVKGDEAARLDYAAGVIESLRP